MACKFDSATVSFDFFKNKTLCIPEHMFFVNQMLFVVLCVQCHGRCHVGL